jgi:uncharacterized protein
MTANYVTASAHQAGAAQRAVAEGLFEGMGSEARLLGSRCLGCGASYFPRSAGCRNPACRDRRIAPVALSRVGTLYSYTVQSYQPPGLFRMDDWAPYPLGLIELPEGLRVMAMLTGCEVSELRIGMPVEMTTETLYRDESGCEVHTYKFRPLTRTGQTA